MATEEKITYEAIRQIRTGATAHLWYWHSTVCGCRSTDGARCSLARRISRIDLELRQCEVIAQTRDNPGQIPHQPRPRRSGQ